MRVETVVLEFVIIYVALINLAGFTGMGRDKRRAIARRPRTPERRLFTYAILGGSVGCILGMLTFRHKTRHLKFTLGMPVILAVQAAAVAVVILYL